jgi:hypothetical protein
VFHNLCKTNKFKLKTFNVQAVYASITQVDYIFFSGVAPPSFVAIQAGTTLHQLTSSGDAVSFKSMLILGVFALVSLLPVVFKKKLKSKFD